MKSLRSKISNLTILYRQWHIKGKFFISKMIACNTHDILLHNVSILSLKYEKFKRNNNL